MRSWLNGGFVEKAFSTQEQSLIRKSPVKYGYSSDVVVDSVFLLSAEEAECLFANDGDRVCKPTDYVAKSLNLGGSDGTGEWWLRPNGRYSNELAAVQCDGPVITFPYDVVYRAGLGRLPAFVRPALRLSL
ncbi:MAG: DUF6273 domain-containing protein [bacterium]|nr:DUF6273 domain-containing protein [bacterium]